MSTTRMGAVAPHDESETSTKNKEKREEKEKDDHGALYDRGGLGQSRSKTTLCLVTLCVTAVAVAVVTAVLCTRGRRAEPRHGASSHDCTEVNVSLLPFLEGGTTTKVANMRWYHAGTMKYFGLNEDCSNCYVRNVSLLCTDGEKMIFGQYDNTTKTGAAMGMTEVCIQGSFNLSSSGPFTRGKDILRSDVADGFNVSTAYLKEEFQLACTVTGNKSDFSTRSRSMEEAVDPGQALLERLPFRGGQEGKPVDKNTLKWAHKEAFEYFGIDDPLMTCYSSAGQLLCTDGKWLVFAEYMDKLDAYAVMGRTAHCIDGYFDPRSVNATESTGDLIADDYVDGFAMTKEHILENTGLECEPLLLDPTR